MTCLMMRAPFERVAIEVTGSTVTATMARWREVQQIVETLATSEEARDRYEAMKMICAVDYGFHVYMENVDAQ